jgi:hypothetical protein
MEPYCRPISMACCHDAKQGSTVHPCPGHDLTAVFVRNPQKRASPDQEIRQAGRHGK